MSDIVDLASYRAAKAGLPPDPALAGELAEIADRLVNLAIDAALKGPWKEWADAQPVGAVLDVDMVRLEELDDERVRALLDLADQVHCLAEVSE